MKRLRLSASIWNFSSKTVNARPKRSKTAMKCLRLSASIWIFSSKTVNAPFNAFAPSAKRAFQRFRVGRRAVPERPAQDVNVAFERRVRRRLLVQQPFERNHLSSLRWPPLAASAHASASHPRRSRAATASRRAARLPPRDRKCSCTSRTRSGSPTARARGDPPARRVRMCARPTGSPPTAATEGARGFPRAPPPRTSTRPTRRRCARPPHHLEVARLGAPPHRLVEDVARVRRAALEQPHQQIEVAVLRGRLAYTWDPPRAARAQPLERRAISALGGVVTHALAKLEPLLSGPLQNPEVPVRRGSRADRVRVERVPRGTRVRASPA